MKQKWAYSTYKVRELKTGFPYLKSEILITKCVNSQIKY